MRTRSRSALALSATVALAAGLATAAVTTAPAAHAAGGPPLGVDGRGADVPFVETEAEDADTNGTVIGPGRTYGTLPSEASGRRAVTLDAPGDYVRFTLTEPADAMDVRYSIPDSADGSGQTAPVDLVVDGEKTQDLSLTSRYGWFYGGYPFSNTPGDNQHHFYDETRTMFGRTLPAGTTVALRVPDGYSAGSVTVDVADFELVGAPKEKPADALDAVTEFGADPTGATDATAALQAGIDAAQVQGRPLWIAAGRFLVTEHLIVDDVTITGAGQWYTELTGAGVGIYGRYVADGGPSRNVNVSSLAVLGEVTERVDSDQVNAFGGAMSDSTISDVWMQHTKVGAWMDGPMDNFHITDSRILDQTADGVNFHTGVTNSSVTNTFVRNAGDDGLAMWAEGTTNADNTFSHNTIIAPVLANNIAIYGGRDITVTDNLVSDTVTNGGGIHVANRYPGVNSGAGTAVAGTFTLARNTLIRAGNSDYNWNFGVGALWFDGLNEPVDGAEINVSDTDIIDSSYEAIQVIEGGVSGLNFSDVTIDGAGTFALQIQTGGAATFENVTATGIRGPSTVYSCGAPFEITDNGGSGWVADSPYCGPWPERVEGSGDTGTPDPTPAPTSDPTPAPSPSPSPPPSPSPSPDPTPGELNVAGSPTASSELGGFPPAAAVDDDASSYWESANGSWPQTLTVDLGEEHAVDRLVIALPPSASWDARTQTIEVSGSA